MSNEIAVTYSVGGSDIKLTPKIVSEYLTGGANITLPEFKLFSELCKARGLNPFLKEAYIIKYGDAPAQIVVGKDAILKRAILNPNFDGREQGIIVLKNNECVEKSGTFILKDEILVGGWAKVYRKNWKYPVYITVSFDEVAQRKRDGSLNSNWATKSASMTEKVALVRALREAFVEDVGGMIEEGEVWESESEKPVVQTDTFEEKEEKQPDIIEQDDALDGEVIDFDEV